MGAILSQCSTLVNGHIADSCCYSAALAADLLAVCPHLHVLATSREALGVAGERSYHVPSLATPDPAHLPPPAHLAAYEAVQLFLERARERDSALRLTPANAGAIATICARLDGLPLALELAAARASVLPVASIATRLDDRFRLLTGGPRTALPRQQTLRATLDWSYHLLDEPERVLLRRLPVFASGWTLEAAEAICAGPRVGPTLVLDLLSALARQSPVVVERREDAARYRLLETIREYALERLEASGEGEEIRRQHAAYYLDLARQAAPMYGGAPDITSLERLEREHDNVRAVLRWAHDHGEVELEARLAMALGEFWNIRGYQREARRWLEGLLVL